MVKKLFKHEMFYYLRIFIPVCIALLGVSVLGRVVQFFESDSIVYSIVNGSSIFAYVVAVIVADVLIGIMSIVRYYQNLFSPEGYLTLTLPVTTTEHIIVKIVSAVLFQIAGLFISFISLCIYLSGDVLAEVIKAAEYLFSNVWDKLGVHTVIFILEFLIIMVISLISSQLTITTCITVGQLFNKHRVLAALGVYYAYYFVTQIIGTIIGAVFGVAATGLEEFFVSIGKLIEKHPIATVNIIAIALIIGTIIWCAVCYFISRYIMERKLNLE